MRRGRPKRDIAAEDSKASEVVQDWQKANKKGDVLITELMESGPPLARKSRPKRSVT